MSSIKYESMDDSDIKFYLPKVRLVMYRFEKIILPHKRRL